MTIKEAEKIIKQFDNNMKKTDEDEFMFTEAMSFLIEKRQLPQDMMYLGGYYYGQKHFDLALKYYEMAAAMDYDEAYECLGYIWYYGRTGKRDFKKAFEYFSKMMEKGNLVATYKVADMYKNGYYVDEDYDKYKTMIEELYPKVKDSFDIYEPIPEILSRLAKIRAVEGRLDDAECLYLQAKDRLGERLMYSGFFGNLSIMKGIVEEMYQIIPFDWSFYDLYDLYYVLKTPHKITFYLDDEIYVLMSVMEGDETVVFFNGKWFQSIDDFFKNATTNDGRRLTSEAYHIYWMGELTE